MEGQTADGSDPLSHEAVVVLDVADHISVGVVDGDELVHGAAGCVVRKRGEEKQCLKQLSNILYARWHVGLASRSFQTWKLNWKLFGCGSRGTTQWSCSAWSWRNEGLLGVSPGKQVGLWVDVQGRQALHRLQHVDGIRHSRLKESNVSVDAAGVRGQGQWRSSRRTSREEIERAVTWHWWCVHPSPSADELWPPRLRVPCRSSPGWGPHNRNSRQNKWCKKDRMLWK